MSSQDNSTLGLNVGVAIFLFSSLSALTYGMISVDMLPVMMKNFYVSVVIATEMRRKTCYIMKYIRNN